MKPLRLRIVCGLVPLLMFGLAGLNGYTYAADDGDQTASPSAPNDSRKTFEQHVQPLLAKHCLGCHNVDQVTSGVRVDHLSEWATAQDERYLRLWEGIRHQLVKGSMPPKEEPQPAQDQLRATVAWIENLVQVARSRPSPKNGSTRRLTVAQYRNTLRDLIGIDEDLAKTLPPDAVSRDGFLNNAETLQLSPLLLEAYFQIAGEALDRVLVDPQTKPTIQNFRVELGRAINASPYAEPLILGANNHLLRNEDFVVRELLPAKPFAFEPFHMQTKFRFIEGYAGNDTVRGWREYDSIYHAVFACMRGSEGYPKGDAYNTVKDGLLLRPAIPSAEEFQVESTYGPKANFKISLRELPSHGRFRVTVKAARYNDGLLLEPSDRLKPNERLSGNGEGSAPVQPRIICQRAQTGQEGVDQEVEVPRAGIYRVDVFQESADQESVKPDTSRLSDMLVGAWPSDPDAKLGGEPDLSGRLTGESRLVDSLFGKAVSLDGQEDALVVPRHANMDVGTGDFTVSAWIRPRGLKQAGLVCLGKYNWTHGWYLDMPDNRGTLRIESAGPDSTSNGSVSSPAGAIEAGVWQHVTAVVRRGENSTRLFVNGYPIAKGSIGPANLDNPKVDLHIGRIQGAQAFRGEMVEVRVYRRALDEAEIQALLASGRQFIKPPRQQPHDLLLSLGDRDFSDKLRQPAFLAVRLPAGSLSIKTQYAAAQRIERVELTRLDENEAIAKRFTEFERRTPTLGVYLGLRRDCGSTLSRVGQVQAVTDQQVKSFVFEGAINDFPSPDVEKDNVNYLAGMREIGVRSEYTDGRDMPRLLIQSVEFEGPLYESWPPAEHRQIFIEPDSSATEQTNSSAYARQVIQRFATRAYRRPVRESELAVLVSVFENSFASGRKFQQSVQDALQVALTSPQFLFLLEQSATAKPEMLDSYELASKLSYFLWNSPPDEILLDLAASGHLHQQLDDQVQRMLQDPRAWLFINQFATQWLSLDKFQVLEVDRERFPKLTRDARTQLAAEPVQTVGYMLRNNLPVRNIIEADFIVANEVVASYYDLGAHTESGFEFVPIVHRRRDLGGLLTQAAILAGLSDGRQSNPIKRGAWLARRIIAEPPDDPPPNVPNLKQETEHLSLRERLEQHRNQSGCAQCHAKIDPYGIPLEEYDAGGRRKADPGDVRSQLPDQAHVTGANDLKRYLAQDRLDQVAFSFLKHLTVYACGRDLTYYELELIRHRGQELKADGYRMQDMLRWVVHSEMFSEK